MKKSVLLEGKNLADSTFVDHCGSKYMLTTPIVDGDNISYLDLYEMNSNHFEPCKSNPVVYDKTKARNGGKIFDYDGKLYRVAQNCGNGYGSGLNILEIEKLSLDEYKETIIKKILPSDVNVKGYDKIDGIHTYNSNDVYEVIDFKENRSFSIVECIGYFLGLIGIYK